MVKLSLRSARQGSVVRESITESEVMDTGVVTKTQVQRRLRTWLGWHLRQSSRRVRVGLCVGEEATPGLARTVQPHWQFPHPIGFPGSRRAIG